MQRHLFIVPLSCWVLACGTTTLTLPPHDERTTLNLKASLFVTRHHSYPAGKVNVSADFMEGDANLPHELGNDDKVFVNGIALPLSITAGPRGTHYSALIPIADTYRYEIVYQGKLLVREIMAAPPDVACKNGPFNQNKSYATEEFPIGRPLRDGAMSYAFEC